MRWMTDELLFYGGILLMTAMLILLIIYVCISQVMKKRLEKRLREEYGDEVIKISKKRKRSRTRA